MPANFSASERPERFGRLVDYYGEEGFRRVRTARVAVVGLGGVGSHAALALARSGVGGLRLIDFDLVTATSLNRSAAAGPADVGRPKAEALAEQLARTCPDTAVEVRLAFCDAETALALLAPPLDWAIDAIDSLNHVLLLPPNQYSQEAQEWTGVAREPNAELATARAEAPLSRAVPATRHMPWP